MHEVVLFQVAAAASHLPVDKVVLFQAAAATSHLPVDKVVLCHITLTCG